MSKIKIRCSRCGKSFKSINAKQLICPECEEKARRERAAKLKGPQLPAGAPTLAPRPTAPPRPVVHSPTPAQPKHHWLDQQTDIKIATPESPELARPPRLDASERHARPAQVRAIKAAHPANKVHSIQPAASGEAVKESHSPQTGSGMAPGKPADHTASGRPQGKKTEGVQPAKDGRRDSLPIKPKREPRQPTPPFVPTPEQVTLIEQRYLELAQPGEFDGIRTQISKELNIPKSAVKKVVYALRSRQEIPSWWDRQVYHGSSEDLERIRSAYIPFLPLPPVGIHKQIATLLNLQPGTVYQAIKTIRIEMDLPQFNPPENHGLPSTPVASSESMENSTGSATGER
jgi:hypothetical protein